MVFLRDNYLVNTRKISHYYEIVLTLLLVKTSFDTMDPPPLSSLDWSATVSDTVADSQESPVPNKLKPVLASMTAPVLNAPMSDFLCYLLSDFQESLVPIG